MSAVRRSVVIGMFAVAVVGCSRQVEGTAAVDPQAVPTGTVVTSAPAVTTEAQTPSATAPAVATEAQTPSATESVTTTSQTPVPADPDAYAGAQPRSYYFTSPSGKFECAILAQSESVVGCHGEMPTDAPRVPGSGSPDTMVAPNSIRVGGDEPGRFASIGDPQFHRFDGVAGALAYGRVLTANGFVCSIDEQAGVTCESPAGHGFTVSDAAYELW